MASPTSSAKVSYTIQEPYFGRDRVLSDAKRRQWTMESHQNQVLREVINIKKVSGGRIGRHGWSVKRCVR
jgi:hypothetical protein